MGRVSLPSCDFPDLTVHPGAGPAQVARPTHGPLAHARVGTLVLTLALALTFEVLSGLRPQEARFRVALYCVCWALFLWNVERYHDENKE
jgi:hypothetical protein